MYFLLFVKRTLIKLEELNLKLSKKRNRAYLSKDYLKLIMMELLQDTTNRIKIFFI